MSNPQKPTSKLTRMKKLEDKVDNVEKHIQFLTSNIMPSTVKMIDNKVNTIRGDVLTLVIFNKAIKECLFDKGVIEKDHFEEKTKEAAETKDFLALAATGPYAVRHATYTLEALSDILFTKGLITEEALMDKAKEVEKKMEERFAMVRDLEEKSMTLSQLTQYKTSDQFKEEDAEKVNEQIETLTQGIRDITASLEAPSQ